MWPVQAHVETNSIRSSVSVQDSGSVFDDLHKLLFRSLSDNSKLRI